MCRRTERFDVSAWRISLFAVALTLVPLAVESSTGPLAAEGPAQASAAAAPAPGPEVAQVRQLVKDGHYADAETAARAFLAGRAAAGETDTADVARMTRALVEALFRGTKAKAPETS